MGFEKMPAMIFMDTLDEPEAPEQNFCHVRMTMQHSRQSDLV